ncbi:protein SPT2 homolog [Octopus bimaculoides]|uniref:protein SPT2 homolog n=1 Tax=Octopus bimaculoides TaxID=37653 RepID=UPI0022E8E983|nr:protein SPT2 homolog [Octopus bimaculoides]
MDFTTLMSIAYKNQQNAEKKLPTSKKYSTQCSAPKKLPKTKVESDVIKRLKEEKEKDLINERITNRIKEQKRLADMKELKKHDRERERLKKEQTKEKIRLEKQSDKSSKLKNVDEKLLSPKMKEKLKEEQLKDKLKRIKLQEKEAESKKETFKIPKGTGNSNSEKGPKTSLSNNNSSKDLKASKSTASAVLSGSKSASDSSASRPNISSKTKKPFNSSTGATPLKFDELMKIALEKAADPKQILNSNRPADRPMTQDEKDRLQRLSSKEYKHTKSSDSSNSRNNNSLKKSTPEIKLKKKEISEKPNKSQRTTNITSENKRTSDSVINQNKNVQKSKEIETDFNSKYKDLESKLKALQDEMKQMKNEKKKQTNPPSKPQPAKHKPSPENCGNANKYTSENNNLLICRPAAKPEEKPLSTWDKIYSGIQKADPVKKPVKRRRVIESDEEEEDDMDGFIDDEPIDDDCQNVSKYIRSIFGYDRRKFKDEDISDIEKMETSFSQQMKEEIRSAKIGRLEDLEDIKREQEELMMLKKRKGKPKGVR